LTEEFNGGRKRPIPNHEDVLAAPGTLLTEYAHINTLLDRANGRMTVTERAQKQAGNQTFDRIRRLYRRAMQL
jgi:hypothetical protein